MSLGDNFLTAEVNQDKIITRTIGESFPDYESVIPKDNKTMRNGYYVLDLPRKKTHKDVQLPNFV